MSLISPPTWLCAPPAASPRRSAPALASRSCPALDGGEPVGHLAHRVPQHREQIRVVERLRLRRIVTDEVAAEIMPASGHRLGDLLRDKAPSLAVAILLGRVVEFVPSRRDRAHKIKAVVGEVLDLVL